MSDCQCSLRTRLVGDGCEICNPGLALDYAKERITTLEADLAALQERLAGYEDTPVVAWIGEYCGINGGRYRKLFFTKDASRQGWANAWHELIVKPAKEGTKS